jgi:ABC transporter substrate binding protein (PQQ-dependent alcohol dehydrogenase system)
MSNGRTGRALWQAALSAALLCGFVAATLAQNAPPDQPAPPQQHIRIAFVQIDGDPRYQPVVASDRIVLKAPEHPFAGAEVGIEEAAPLTRLLNADFTLERLVAKSPADVTAVVSNALDGGTHFFLIDAPAEAYRPLAAAVSGREALLFNVSTPDDPLRRDLCAAEFVHAYPSQAQLADGLVQYLVSRKWTNLLTFQGPSAEDATIAGAFAHSAQKFGARVVASQHFKPGTDPRDREQNDPALLSAINRDFDVVFVADRDFDFARSVPYHLLRPRPVVGSIDLVPVAWHWTWDHNGAPQVNSRFEKKSGGRHMEGADWAAWIAVKMIVQSALRTHSADFGRRRAFILGDGSFDGDKGLAVSVRPWDHQLRQAVLLAAPYEVVAAAPIEGFLHQTNDLDTLGDDQPESPCHLKP